MGTPREHEWRCLYCGKRFVVRSDNDYPAPPAGANTVCNANPNGKNCKHVPIKVS